MASRVRRSPRTNEIWPGFVDALSALLMVIIFLLVAFMLAQYFLSVALSGRDEALDRLTRRVNELSDLLSLERQANAELRLDIAQLSSELQSSTASRDELSAQLSIVLAERNELSARLTSVRDERDKLSARLTSVLSENDALDLRLVEVTDRAQVAEAQAEALRAALAEAESTIAIDRETVELKLAEIASLRQDLAALRTLRADLEAQITQLAEVLDESRAAVAQLETESERQLERNRVLVVRLGQTEEERELERERRRALELQLAEAETESEQERERNRLVVIDLGKAETALAASRAEITQLRDEFTAVSEEYTAVSEEYTAASKELTAVRDRTKRLEARLSDEEERTALAQSEIEKRDIRLDELRLAVQQSDEDLIGQKALSARAQAQVELLNQQIIALRQQLARIAKALEVAEAEAEEQQVVIANLGQKLNLALAGKVEELQRYRSEFFGRLREVLGDREGIEIVGDRFVFQSEVLFNSGSAVLEDEGERQMGQLAETLIDIAREIPEDLPWILRVDGHTDILPIRTQQFPSNWELSTARAISVVRFLISKGVPADHVAATGFGEFQPIDPRETEEAFRHNRRIELKLTNR